TEEKLAVSNAVRDVYAQLLRVHPGLGGGFKLSVVRGAHRVTVVAFGRCGHALANGPEQIILGYSII
ncbi:MAG: HutP family protein, partial [bacterium]|nr:HutP family protein [bacterium]